MARLRPCRAPARTGGAVRRCGAGLLALLLTASACSEIPRDPDDTLEAARGGVLRVGIAEAPPWVVRAGPEPRGVEAELIRSFAAGIGARVEWSWGAPEAQLEKLEKRELAIVAAGLTRKTPWRGRVALTRPHTETGGEAHVLATAPGENALLTALERHLRRR